MLTTILLTIKILVLMFLIIHKRLKSENLQFSIFFRVFDCTWAQNGHNLAALHLTSLCELHRVPHVIVLQTTYILLRNC